MLLLVCDTIFAQADIYTGPLNIDVGSYGRIRLYTTTAADTIKHVERVSILVGVAADQVFDYQNDVDIEEPVVLLSQSSVADFEIYGAFNNVYSALPPDILQKLYVYGWNNEKYTIVKNVLINRESSTIDAIVGVDFIAEVDNDYGFDTVSYNASNQIMDTYRGGSHVGFKFLSHQINSLTSITWYDGYYDDASYWDWLTHGAIDDFFVADADGPVSFPAIQSVTLNSGDSITVYFAVAVGANEAEMIENINKAVDKYGSITSIKADNSLVPANYNLLQNYPNAFNPSAKITFELPAKDFVTLKIFNTLGQEISTLVNSELEAGRYTVDFNAADLPSGAYFYKISAGNFTSSKKMLLTK